MKNVMKKFRKIWNIVYLPLIAIGTIMSILSEMLTFRRESSRKKFRTAETTTWLFQSIGAVLYNVTGFFHD